MLTKRKMYFVKSPYLLKKLYHSRAVWDLAGGSKKVYLTFDDGPVPQATPFVIETLAKYNAKATFFCVGDNVAKYPELLDTIIANGHSVGNHTFNHLKGWKTPEQVYLENVERCSDFVNSDLFRPPYGRLTKQQGMQLSKEYKLIFWTILSGDYDVKNTPEDCYKNVVENMDNGSIIVFHDSIKAFGNLEDCLPRVLDYCVDNGYECAAIPQNVKVETA